MINFYPDTTSSLSPTAQWKGYLNQQSQLLSAVRTQNKLTLGIAVGQYLISQRQTQAIVSSVENASNRQIEAARQDARMILGAISMSTEILENATREVKAELTRLGSMLDGRLAVITDQILIGNLLTQNVAELMRVPDFQKERQYYIEQGFKHSCQLRMKGVEDIQT